MITWTTMALMMLLIHADGRAFARQTEPVTVQRIEVLRHHNFTITLTCRTRASMSDEVWLAIHVTNATDRPLVIRQIQCNLNARRSALDTKQGLRIGEIGSLTAASVTIRPGGTYDFGERPSQYAAAALGWPDAAGELVAATVSATVLLEDHSWVRSPEGGSSFEFQWTPPGEDGVQRLRHRARLLLRNPGRNFEEAYLLGVLLDTPRIAAVATREEIIGALIVRRDDRLAGREAVARFVANHLANDDTIRDFYIAEFAVIASGAVHDLRFGLWHLEFVEPLVALIESGDSRSYPQSLYSLHEHRDEWRGNARIVNRLFAALQEREARAMRPVSGVLDQDLSSWASAVRDLRMTGHLSLIEILRPALDDRRQFRRLRDFSSLGNRVPALRACDEALDGMLTILDGSPDDAYQAAGMPSPHGRMDESDVHAIRDAMIAELERRLNREAE